MILITFIGISATIFNYEIFLNIIVWLIITTFYIPIVFFVLVIFEIIFLNIAKTSQKKYWNKNLAAILYYIYPSFGSLIFIWAYLKAMLLLFSSINLVNIMDDYNDFWSMFISVIVYSLLIPVFFKIVQSSKWLKITKIFRTKGTSQKDFHLDGLFNYKLIELILSIGVMVGTVLSLLLSMKVNPVSANLYISFMQLTISLLFTHIYIRIKIYSLES